MDIRAHSQNRRIFVRSLRIVSLPDFLDDELPDFVGALAGSPRFERGKLVFPEANRERVIGPLD